MTQLSFEEFCSAVGRMCVDGEPNVAIATPDASHTFSMLLHGELDDSSPQELFGEKACERAWGAAQRMSLPFMLSGAMVYLMPDPTDPPDDEDTADTYPIVAATPGLASWYIVAAMFPAQSVEARFAIAQGRSDT